MDIEGLQGRVFGQFELHELLGKGGMSAVYRAYQACIAREVAFKVLSPNSANSMIILNASKPKHVSRHSLNICILSVFMIMAQRAILPTWSRAYSKAGH